MMKFSDKLLYNSWLLIALGIGSVFYMMHFFCTGNTEYGVIFICFGALTSVFSRNMVVILVMALIATELVRLGHRITAVNHWSMRREGLTTKATDTDPATNPANTEDQPSETEQKLDSIQEQVDTIQTELDALKKTLV